MFIPYTNMEGRQPQHLENVNRSRHDQTQYDCSSEERTLFHYISHHPGELGQFLVQSYLGRQQYLLYRETESYIVGEAEDV